MAKQISAVFSLLAFLVFATTWIIRKLWPLPVVDVTELFLRGLAVLFFYFLVGIFLARLGISLIQEVIEARRIKEEQHRQRARLQYQQIIGEEESESKKTASK